MEPIRGSARCPRGKEGVRLTGRHPGDLPPFLAAIGHHCLQAAGAAACTVIAAVGPWGVACVRCEADQSSLVLDLDVFGQPLLRSLLSCAVPQVVSETRVAGAGLPVRTANALIVPLCFDVLGALVLEFSGPVPPAGEWPRLAAVADLAARCISQGMWARLDGLLADVARLFAQDQGPGGQLAAFARCVAQAFGPDFACDLFLLDAGRRWLDLRGSSDLPPEEWSGHGQPADAGLNGWVLQHRQPLTVADTAENGRFGGAPGVRHRAVAAVPVCAGTAALGVLHLGAREPYGFTVEETAILQGAANQAAMAIERAQLRQRA